MTRIRHSNVFPKSGRFLWASLVAFAVAVCLAGTATAAERKLTFAVRGVVAEILVQAGDRVSAGQPLARLDEMAMKIHLGVMEAKVKAAELSAIAANKNQQREQELFDAISSTSAKVEAAELAAAQAAADLAQAEGRLKMAKMQLDWATLKAPFAGTVISVPGFPGQVVNPDTVLETVVVVDDGP